MVVRYKYLLKFPFGASFNKDLKYLIYSSLFREIKKITCINLEGTCETCPLSDTCIYYHLSGENFNNYPGVIIDRFIVEKRKFKSDEIIELNIYLFQSLIKFEGFIRKFIEDNNNFFDHFYQIIKFDKEIIKIDGTYDGEILAVTPISQIDKINNQLEYYNDKYDTNFNLKFEIFEVNTKKVKDRNNYYINGVRINLEGLVGELKVNNLDKILFTIGIGKQNFFGGGKIHENKN